MKKQFIKEVVLKKLTNLISEVGEFNYNKKFTPTDIVAKKAQEALNQIGSQDFANKKQRSLRKRNRKQ